MDSMINKAKDAAEKLTGHEHKDESKLHHLKHEAEKKVLKHQAKNFAEDHGFSRKKHHDNQDESLLDKAKDAVGKYTGHEDSHSHKKDKDDSIFDKAKDAVDKYTGHGDSHSHKKDNQDDVAALTRPNEAVGKYVGARDSHSHKKDKDDDSIFDKAKDAVEKYTKKH
ncbi:hypothetical protein ON010_g2887 [Phytophthora cinnamomi]|nr:hypothetical protein ON010_g2887 [Phytophthora cinnamomi]